MMDGRKDQSLTHHIDVVDEEGSTDWPLSSELA